MQSFELTVNKTSRLLIGIVILSISFPGLIILSAELDNSASKILTPLFLLILLVGLIYWIAFAKIILSYSDNRISFEWKKRFPFDNSEIRPINITDIKRLVVDKGMFLRKIILKDRLIMINNGKPIKNDFRIFIRNLIEIVEKNNGQVIDSRQYATEQGFSDLGFELFIIFFALSIFLISRLWSFIEFYTLFLLLLPLIAYYIHIKLRIRKKTGGNNVYTK